MRFAPLLSGRRLIVSCCLVYAHRGHPQEQRVLYLALGYNAAAMAASRTLVLLVLVLVWAGCVSAFERALILILGLAWPVFAALKRKRGSEGNQLVRCTA